MFYNNHRFKKLPATSRASYPSDYSFYEYSPYPPSNHFGVAGGSGQQHQQPYHQQSQHQQYQQGRGNPNKNQRDRPSPSHDDYKIYICPGCLSYFDCLSRNNRYTGRVPLILHCRHTVCQECIYKAAQIDHIICPTCKKPSQLSKKHLMDNIQEAFTPNYYIFGIIMWGKPQGNHKPLALVPAQVTLNKKSVEGNEEEEEPTSEIGELEKCAEHTGMDVEFFCKTCGTGACCYCFIEKHEGHERDYLSKLSDAELSEFNVYKEKAEQILKQLLISQKKLRNLCAGTAPIVENKICSYFTDFHARIYLVQKDLQKQLSSIQSVGKLGKGLGGIGSSLDSSIGTLKNVLMSADSMNVKKINLRGLMQKLKDVQVTPCYLLSQDGTSSDPLEFEVDPVLENIEELIKLKKLEDCKYTLVGADELPPDYVADPADAQFESDAESCVSSLLQTTKKEETNQHNKRISSQSNYSNLSKPSAPGRPAKFDNRRTISNSLNIPLDNEKVEVTHIESLECFYVQLRKSQSRFIQMNKDIENYVKMGAMKVEHPQVNELYLAMYVTKKEKMWCRGRLMEIKNRQADPLYEVFFIDYGSTQTLNITKLREITPTLAQRKPFAMQCELYNPTFASWGKNAHVYMGKMINGKEIFMMVKNVHNGTYQVDLMVSSSDRGLTSIIDILIHTCSNALSTSSDSSSISSQRRDSFVPEHKIFSNSMNFVKNQTEKVILANVIDPHNVFVHIAAYVESLKKMISQLKQHYKSVTYETCIPIEGTFVVVEHRDVVRGNWHRALVKKVDMNAARAQVLLVDWGNNVIVPWSCIRLLNESFTKLESQAVLVKLAHIEPYKSEHVWSEKATHYLQKNFRTRDILKMVVYEVDPLEVALFEPLDTVDICINAQLVQEKLAESTGKISQTLEWPQNNQDQPGFTEDEGFVATLLKKVDEGCDIESEEEELEVHNLVKQQIDVIKVVSPELIYIKFLHLEDQELSLHKELQIYYHEERDTKESWEEKEDCVVLYTDYYVRGKILEKVEDQYKINVYDKATELILPKERIYVYSNYFRKYPNIVYKSYLARIRPAGGDKWSLSSIEALERMFDKYKEIYATKVQGDISNKSMPMLMWYTQVKVGGALEPSITKFVSINNLLVKLGVAYKDLTKPDSGTSKEDMEPSTSGILELAANKLTSLESTNSEVTGNDVEVEEINVSSKEAQDKGSLNSSDCTNADSSSDWNELIEKEEKKSDSKQDSPYRTQETEIIDWKPAFPIEKREFNAWVTCAETGGILYLRDEDLQPVYRDMEANLKQYFDENKPTHKKKKQWLPGQICTISYKDYWYRGKILNVTSPTEIVAVMIDFGSDHVLTPKQLYREILYPEIPAFASRIKLDKVFAKSGAWLSSDYDTLLEVVTEFAKVVIKGPLDVDIPLAEVYTKTGHSVNQQLVDKCPNLTRSTTQVCSRVEDDVVVIEEEELLSLEVEPEEHLDTTTYEFKMEPLPENAFKEKTSMSVIGALSYNQVVLRQATDISKELYLLGEKIQKDHSKQPVLQEIKVGMPCISPYAEDGVWYRARIHNIDGLECGYVFVFFVDFGNVESVSVQEVKMMKPEWFKLPVPCYIAMVNFELKTDNHLEHVFQHMKKLAGKQKLVEFVSEEPMLVNLYEKSGELCYQLLVNNGLLKIK